MTDRFISGLMLVVAVIHLLPVSGFFGANQLASLYGIELADRNLEILMRHRAVMFAILGAFFAYAAFKPGIQPIAFVAAMVSICSFFYLALTVGDFNAEIRKVVIADGIALVALTAAIVLYVARRSGLPGE